MMSLILKMCKRSSLQSVYSYQVPPPYEGMLPAAGGDLIPWSNGNFMVTWGFSGVLEEVNKKKENVCGC